MEAWKVPVLGPESRVEFHALVVHEEPGRDPLLGRPALRRFLEVDPAAVAALAALREAPTLAEAERLLHARTGDEVDLAAFVRSLAERGFVRAIDGVEVAPSASEAKPLFARVRPGHLRWLVSPALAGIAGALVIAWLAAVVADRSLLPGYRDLFLVPDLAVVLLAGFVGLLVAAYAHELAHFFVARAYGVDATIGVSHRFLLLVLETDVTNAWTLPRRRQLAVFAAGSVLNLAVVAAAMLLVAGAVHGPFPFSPRTIAALRFVAYVNLFPLFFQLMFFARTDLYYVLLVLLRERNLIGDARAFMAWKWRRTVSLARRDPGRPCPSCRIRVFDEDPWCVACGAPRAVADPNRYAFERRSRGRLAAFAVVLVVGQAAGYALLATLGLRFQVAMVAAGIATFVQGIDAPDFWTLLAGEWLVLLSVAQLVLLASFLLAGLRPLVSRLAARVLPRAKEDAT